MAPPVASSTPATNISRPVPEFFNHGNRLSTKKVSKLFNYFLNIENGKYFFY